MTPRRILLASVVFLINMLHDGGSLIYGKEFNLTSMEDIHDTAKGAYDMFLKYPNIGYLGLGYDPIYGNPKSIPSVSGTAGRDPGFRSPVFQLDSYSEEDGIIEAGEPDGVDTSFCIECTMDVPDVQVMGGAFGYSVDLDKKVETKASLIGVQSAMSAEFRLVSEMTGIKLKLVIESEVACCAYKAWIDETITEGEAHLPLHENFINGVLSLPETWESEEDRELYRKFIKVFGTHYIYYVEMGGRIGIQSIVDRESFSTMNSVGSSVEVSASAGLFGIGVGFESSSSSEYSMAKEYEKKCDSTKLYTIGGKPHFSAEDLTDIVKTAAKWMLSIRTDAMPIATKIDSISALLNEEKFPLDVEKVAKIKQNLDYAIKHQCLDAMKEAGISQNMCQEGASQKNQDAPLPPVWEATGVGSPVGDEFYDLDRVGGQCAGDDSVMSGFHFQRGGCKIVAHWEDGVLSEQACEEGVKEDGLMVNMLCSRHEHVVSDPTWHYTGTGSPVMDLVWMDRVGVQCPDGQVLSGLKFQRGGCDWDTMWHNGNYGTKICVKRWGRPLDKDPNTDEGLTAWARCSTFHMPLGESHWYGTGVGTIGTLGHKGPHVLARVGGTCPPGEVARGFKFIRGGCGLDLDWRQGKLNYDVCDGGWDGLIMLLLCAKPEGWRGTFPGDVGLPAPVV